MGGDGGASDTAGKRQITRTFVAQAIPSAVSCGFVNLAFLPSEDPFSTTPRAVAQALLNKNRDLVFDSFRNCLAERRPANRRDVRRHHGAHQYCRISGEFYLKHFVTSFIQSCAPGEPGNWRGLDFPSRRVRPTGNAVSVHSRRQLTVQLRLRLTAPCTSAGKSSAPRRHDRVIP